MAPFTTEVDWTDPAAFYLGDGSLADLADVANVHWASGLRLPAHSHILAQQSRVMRDLFLSMRGQTSGHKRKADEEESTAVELESPFNDFSLGEVSFLLRFMYRPADLHFRNLESVVQHLPGMTRLANSLDAVVQLATIDEFLTLKAARSYNGAMEWMQLAEQCGLDRTWAAGVRALAAKGLSSLGRDTITAVLAAVAASLRGFGSQTIAQAASAIPDAAILLAGRNEAAFGSASLLWEVPQLSGARASRQSPAFGPANWRGSSANAPMFHLEVHGPQEVPLNDAGNGPLLLGNGLSVTLVATFKDDCPPGVALAAVLTVGLHGGSDALVMMKRRSQTLSKSKATIGWTQFIDTDTLLARLASNVRKGTFKAMARPGHAQHGITANTKAQSAHRSRHRPQNLSEFTMSTLEETARHLAAPGKGLLASDESTGTIGKRLEKAGFENTEASGPLPASCWLNEARRAYRQLFYTAPIGEAGISGAILFKETLYQSADDGTPFVECLRRQGVLPGIKARLGVDEGLVPLEGCPGETSTRGLEGLASACAEYASAGARFAKWRAALKVGGGCPSEKAIEINAAQLAEYAAICQAQGLVPIVEPELLIDGDHTLAQFAEASTRVISRCVAHLWQKNVVLEATLLKPQMCIPGADHTGEKPTSDVIADETLRVMRRCVPAAVPGIMFLSGGQTEEEATVNLNAINRLAQQQGRAPWSLSFSFGRSLQASVLKLWSEDREGNAQQCRDMAAALARANSQAVLGRYEGPHPSITSQAGSLRETFRGWRTDV
ncbi:hypothetical protein COHA_001695 [Chlorella ohadii]|uniref:fructose-bisphosphate aldolase n=1 Tax=Chlorella ohadii TaxID=2649997 RepID=A0AAD5DYY1_9CHLO|nr:hypothetical protein COHA_001695 [Chlorella ohadii]